MILMRLFSGNYFGGEVGTLSEALLTSVSWSDAIKAADSSRIYPIVNKDTGEFSGNIRPYNEYYLVAYLANMTSAFGSKVSHLQDISFLALKTLIC